MNLSTPVASIPFIGPIYASRLAKLGIVNVRDFLHHYPRRYADFSLIASIGSLQGGETVTIQGKVLSIRSDHTRSRLTIQKATVSDGTGSIDCTWFNQPFLAKSIPAGTMVSTSGLVTAFRGKPVLESPEYEIIANGKKPSTVHTGRLVPLYPETYGVSSKWLRSRIVYLLSHLQKLEEDYLPEDVKQNYQLLDLPEAIAAIHFPETAEIAQKARYRLAFDEVLISQLSSLVRKQEWKSEITPYQLKIKNYLPVGQAGELRIKEFTSSLPFTLTTAQERCLKEILSDLSQLKPMNRLLQGDVGSGKTVVAGAAMYAMNKSGYNCLLMAPTEILAHQHFQSIKSLMEPFGIPVALITSSTKTRDGNEPITIGTHALLFNQKFDKVGLVIIDEQHRFGVEQRTRLRELGIHPHLLAMTATPIPRSIALVVYSELDLSYLDEMPKGRIRIKTWLVPNEKREKAYEWIKKQLRPNSKLDVRSLKLDTEVRITDNLKRENNSIQLQQSNFTHPTSNIQHLPSKSQAFVICPLIEESDHETMVSVKAVTKEFETLKKEFSEFTLGLLHGKLKSKEKKEILEQFSKGDIDILLATPVVEVGIDIPNATIMVIEAAERFGLAQLHQLRGRVGRGAKQSYCLLFTESVSEKTIERLKSLETIQNGSILAELDLKLRGPGDLFGRMQHGFLSFKLASFSDRPLIVASQQAAHYIIDHDLLKTHELLRKRLESYTIHKISPN